MTAQHIDVAIAGFTIRLAIRDGSLYETCLSSGLTPGDSAGTRARAGKAAVTLDLTPSKPPPSRRIPAEHRLEGYGEYGGWVDLENGHGGIALGRSSPLESLANGLRQLCTRLVWADHGLVLHASAVVRNKHAYIFCGRSGAGKTTICGLSPRGRILSDDLTAVRRRNGRFLAWGLPTGRFHPFTPPDAFPVRAIFKLVQDTRNKLSPLQGARGVAELLVMPPASFRQPDRVGKMLEVVDELTHRVPCYELRFRKDPSFWKCVKQKVG